MTSEQWSLSAHFKDMRPQVTHQVGPGGKTFSAQLLKVTLLKVPQQGPQEEVKEVDNTICIRSAPACLRKLGCLSSVSVAQECSPRNTSLEADGLLSGVGHCTSLPGADTTVCTCSRTQIPPWQDRSLIWHAALQSPVLTLLFTHPAGPSTISPAAIHSFVAAHLTESAPFDVSGGPVMATPLSWGLTPPVALLGPPGAGGTVLHE